MRALVLLALAACEWNGPIQSDANGPIDGHRVDGNRDSSGQPVGHLLLTEIALAPTGGEFIEIANPTTKAVALDNYYLSDNGNYFTLPTGATVISGGDFVVQFPASASLAPGAVITVATGTAAAFQTTYGMAPTYSIADGTVMKTLTSGTPGLTDGGEIVVLFEWDGAADLVKDVDIMIPGSPTAANGLVSKSGLVQGASMYAVDANTIAGQAALPGSGKSTKRIMAEGANEAHDGTGNGISGDDETSEDTSMTWDSTFTAPTPGSIPAL